MACKPAGISKSRVDVWQPKMKAADSNSLIPARWVSLETPANLSTNQKRGNALVGLSIKDSLYNSRKATLRITNRCNDYKSIYDDTNSTTIAATTYTHTYNDSDGNDAAGGARTLQRSWGLYTNFFYEFQFIRVVDTQTNLVLFSGRIYKIDKKYEDGQGSVVVLECRDALEELAILSCKSLAKDVLFPSTWRRSDYIKYGLLLAFNYHAANVAPAGGSEQSQLTPSNADLGTTFNITNANISTSDSGNTYRRFERSATTVGHVATWRLNNTGSKSLLQEFVRFAISEPHDDETADDQFGYDFFVDSNIGSANLGATTGPPAAQFNYFKRGNRLSKVSDTSQAPDTFGLTVHFPVAKSEISQGHKTEGDPSVTTVAKKIMHRAFDFSNPNDEMFTHGILTYNAVDDSVEAGVEATSQRRKVEKAKQFEVIWVNHLNGQMAYKDLNIDDEWKKITAAAPGVDSAELLDAYNIAGSLQAAGVARAQYQSNPGNASTTADFHYLMLSDITGSFPTANYGSDAYVRLFGRTSGKECRFNADSIYPQEGRPSKVWGIVKTFHLTKMNITNPNDLRIEMASKLAQASSEIRRGTYQVTKAPYYWYDAKVRTISTQSPGQRITIKDINGSSSIDVTTYGFREGMLVHKMNSTFSGIEQANSEDVYGYCFNMVSNISMDIDLTEDQVFAVGDNIRLFIPIRAGDNIRVDNQQADILGDHIITSLEYNEYMGPITQIESIGANEGRQAGGVSPRQMLAVISTIPQQEEANTFLGDSKGNQYASFDGTVSYAAANRIAWTAGNLTTMDGTAYQIVASDTSDSTHGLGASGMTGTNKYVLYLDPDGENLAANAYHIKTIILSSYKQDADNIRLMTAQKGENLPSVKGDQLTLNGDGSPFKEEADLLIHNETMTAALLKKGARPWTSDLDIQGTAFNAIEWDNGTDDTNARLDFSDGSDIITIVADEITGLGAGTHYLYLNGVTGTLTPTTTTSHATSIGDAKILLALITVGSSTQGTSPTILPFNSKSLTINAVAMAADVITATHIQTDTISADRLTSAAQATITEKTITHVGSSAPSSPRTMDIWFDTSGSPTVIKVWNGSSWALQNSNAPEGGGGANIFSNPLGTVPNTANSGGNNIPSVAVARYDLWMTSDTNQLYQALHATTNDSISTGEWTLKNDADAINYAGTSINGGLIKTQRIKLLDGGSLNSTANAFETTLAAVVSTLRLINDSGGISASDTTVGIDAWSDNGGSADDLRIYAGDVIQIDSEAMYVESGSDTSLTVQRAWLGTTAATHADTALISKYNYDVTALANPHIIMDNSGITGYSDAFTPEFSLYSTTGKAYFGEGKVVADCSGLSITGGSGLIKFYNDAGVRQSGFYASGDITYWGVEPGKSIWIGDNLDNTDHQTDTITLVSDYLKIVNIGGNHLSMYRYKFPSDVPDVDDVLTVSAYASGTASLAWTPAAGGGSGDITAVNTTSPITGGGSSGSVTITHSSAAGDKHIPSGGSSDQVLTYSSSGTAVWADPSAGTGHTHTSSLTIEASTVRMALLNQPHANPGFIYVSANLHPTTSSVNLGASTAKWDNIHCDDLFYNDATNTSDARIKTDIQDLTNANSLAFIDSLRPRSYKRLDNAGETIDRVNYGLVAQEIEEALTGLSIDKTKFGLLYLPDTETIKVIDPDGTEAEVPNPRGLRYMELIAPLIGAVKELKARIEVLEGN